ncbi:E1A-binding protein p400-like isoform X5 [Coregonus clupeaformis]|uniref:E1A-binding protein p400-like isoform X5 n=1 Tax=Coregonus clupeaformis TaxID=59861 RepID=UPI001E1C45F4|nr:E1A-binding protein p400-like isoform X5 [Coregonus clupeaformis]
MHHGSGQQHVQRQLQRSKSTTGSEAEDQQQQTMAVTQQQATANHPQSPVTTFASAASPSAPQSPNYQIIMSRSPVTSQNMNITLQNVSQMVTGNQQITLTPLPLQNPGSPGFQHTAPQWRFEHAPSSYIQVTSPLPQSMQPQSPTQHNPVPLQRPGAPGTGLSVCGQSPTRFVDTGMLVRQISLGSPSGSGHFVYQEGTGLTQLAPTTAGQVQLQLSSPGAPGSVRERRLSQPHSQTGGTIHHLGPQSPVVSGTALPTLASPGHITTSNLPPQISSIIQGQLARPMIFEKTLGVVAGVGTAATTSFSMPSTIPPSSPSLTNPPQGIPNPPLTPTGMSMGSIKKQIPKKLEEIAPTNPEVAQLRKQCLEHHTKKMEGLKEVFKDYLIELFFLQHLQGNMMDYLAFKKKPCVPLFTYLRQNDLDLEEEEEEEEQSEVINDEVKVVTGKDGQAGTPVAIATQLPPNVSAAFSSQQQFQVHLGASGSMTNPGDMDAFKRQQAMAHADQAKRSRIEVGRHGMIFQHPGALGSAGVPLQQLMPTAQGGMPPNPQSVQIPGQKQNQPLYDPSKGPPVQNAASLHTPPPQLPGRLPQGALPMAALPMALSQQSQLVESSAQAANLLQAQVKVQGAGPIMAPVNPHTQLQVQLQQQMQSGLHLQMQAQQLQQPQPMLQPGQVTVALARPGADSNQPGQRKMINSLSNPSMSPAPLNVPNSLPSPHTISPLRPPGSNITPATQSKLAGPNGTSTVKMGGFGQGSGMQSSEGSSQDKQAEQTKLESQVHQRISELRKEGQWSASRLPKLMESSRSKSHWDYLLEEMQWMAADFAQERRWKMAAAKKLVRTCSRYHDEQNKMEEKFKKEEELRLRHIASTIAREVEFFWSNIEQVVEIKLQFEIYEKRLKTLSLQRASSKGQDVKPAQSTTEKAEKDEPTMSTRKRKSSTSLAEEVQDEESTIEEQEAMEVLADQKAELADLAIDAEMPLDVLVKQYAGAYADNFDWPQPATPSDEEDRDETEDMESPLDSPHEAVVIDSLLSVDQYRGSDKACPPGADGKPRKDIAEVAAATELILPKGSARTTSSVRSQAPFLLHGSLRDYQQIGVDWLASLHKKHLNGILADETALGKTVQTVAYLAHLACQEGIWGPHLVVVRTCKMLSWEMEFKRWCPGFKILLYLGNRHERRAKRRWWAEANSFHVCVTSYKLLLKDQSHFLRRRWKNLVLDEVQLIKNMSENHWETIFALKNQQRILLINTPLHNTLKELWTMIHFLLPGITRPFTDFPVKPGTDQNQDYCHKLVIRLHRMIQPFILRRCKRDVEKQLPKKYEHIIKCRLSSRQKSMYEDILTQPGAQEALKTGHFVSVLQVLMQLQRICNHPDLVNIRETNSSYVCSSLQYNTPSLVLGALQEDQRKSLDLSMFDLISNENRLTRYETEEVLPKLKVTRQLIEEIHGAPDPPARPKPCKIKPMRLFQPVQYGTKPEGRLVPMTSTVGQQRPPATTTTTTATGLQPAQTRGKSPVTTTTTTTTTQEGGDVVKIAQLASIAGSQNRISQPETPVTLQFQGNKFTLSPSQLRQLTTGQPLQLQGTLGNILQIVSAPGQQILRPQGSMLMQTVPQAVPVSNSSTTPGTPPPATSTYQASGVSAKPAPAAPIAPQESSEERSRLLKERLSRLFSANERRCGRSVLYGADLLQACSVTPGAPHSALSPRGWRWVGRESCLRAQRTPVATTTHLQSALLSSTHRQDAGNSLVSRLSCVVPVAVAPPPHLYAANPPAPYSLEQKLISRRLQVAAAPHSTEIHRLSSGHQLQFSDLQLMQMDSGKLEALAILLQKLRSENHRVLIFTQMVKMLDILEAFLDHRQLTYIRVDESLTTEERQEHMKTFNRNRQMFCSILTNRCCSAVGTVFDADTIIFYDTDLNPSVDARTQEWCEKIGRFKDIHIYRLESGNSIEEKLLKNGTKDLIREVAAQGTDYTLAFLTQRTIQDLFEVEAGSGEKVEEFVVLHQEPSPSEAISPRVARPYIQALHSISLNSPPPEQQEEEGQEDLEKEAQVKEEPSQLEELNAVMDQLTPIEKYALQYLEYLHVREDEHVAKERLLCAKRGWEMQHLQKLKAEDSERMIIENEEDLFTYTREDAYNMEYVFDGEDGQTEIMPLWTPPTPPQDDNDIYIDSVICLMYDSAPMPESKLPPVYIRKEHKRLKMDPSAGRKKKKGHGETVIPPRSLFEKASMLKVRREGKDQKKNFSLKQQAPFAKPLPSLVKPAMEAGQDNPEWLISEDWALLQAVKQLLELPLNLTIVSPAHTPNWDLVSDVVNSCSRVYRSPKQCRNRYENVIIPREEGKLVYEVNPKKKTKSIYKSKNSRPLRTCQIYTQDDNATHIQLYNSRFELMKIIASKRSPPIKPLLGMNPFQKNPKHASVLAESGIGYDKPLPPIQVASQRAERIAKEKKALAEQQRAQQLAQQAGATQAVAGAAQSQAGAPTAGQAQAPGVPQAPAVTGATAVPNTAVLAGAIKNAAVGTTIQAATVAGNVIVNTVPGVPPSPFQANKRLASPGQVIPGTLSPAGAAGAQVVHSQQRVVPATATPGEVIAIATGQGVRAVTPVTASAVVSTTLTPVQSQTRSLVTQVTPATGMQLPQGKPITQAHLHMLRQQQLQQQQQQAASPQGIKAVGKPQELLKMHKQKMQMAQQQQQASQVQPANPQAAQANPQLAAVAAAPRAGAVLAGSTVANLQVARLCLSVPPQTRVPTQGQIQAQPGQTAQVTLTKPPVVSVPAVVSSAGVTTLPVTVAGISVAIGQAQKTGGPVLQPPFPQMQVQQLLQMKKQQAAVQAAAAQQKAVQPQPGPATVQQKLGTQQVTVQGPQAAQQQQKVTYAATTQLQPGIKTQFFTTSIAQAGKPTGAQQIQVAKLPQIMQGQSTVANIQQIVSSPQQIHPQTVPLTQTASSAQPQVQMIPSGTSTAQVVQQKLLQQQVVTAVASPQIQTTSPHSPAQQAQAPAVAESPVQQQPAKAQARGGAMRGKNQAKPSGGSS